MRFGSGTGGAIVLQVLRLLGEVFADIAPPVNLPWKPSRLDKVRRRRISYAMRRGCSGKITRGIAAPGKRKSAKPAEGMESVGMRIEFPAGAKRQALSIPGTDAASQSQFQTSGGHSCLLAESL